MRRYRVENIDGCLDNYYKKYCRIRFMTGATQEEFFLLDFYHKTQKQIQGYMTDYILHQNLWNMDAGAVKDESEFEDKKVLYKLLPELFGRRLISVSKESNYEDFEKFVTNASKIILKPNYACMGRGIFATTINNVGEAKILYQALISLGGEWIVEEWIVQDEKMAIWNDTSVNTIRFYSTLDQFGNYNNLTPVLRTGRKGSVIDNAGSGGIFANIDMNTGQVITDGIDENGNYYTCHPDSKVVYKNWQVPEWESLCKLVKNLHKSKLKHHRYIGWDWAYSSQNGWILIEANWGQFLNQYADKIGRRNEFLKYVGK